MNLVVVNVIVDWLAGWMLEGPVHCWGGWTEDDYIFAIIGHLDADPQYTLVCHSVTRTYYTKKNLGGENTRAFYVSNCRHFSPYGVYYVALRDF